MHAEAAYPGEACGALLGRPGLSLPPSVTRAIPLRNSDPWDGDGYRIGPDELRGLPLDSGDRGERLVGFYHSHPDRPSRPSELDLRLGVPGLWYVAVSVRAGRAGARSAWLPNPLPGTGVDTSSEESVCPS